MRHRIVAVLVLVATVSVSAQSGTLVIVGGGNTGPEIVSRALDLAGGKKAIVVVLPQSSAEPDAGDESVKMWREAGARDAQKVSFADRSAAASALERATLIWMPGGDQNRFMKAIDGTGLADVIRQRYRAGAVVGGTSAGAAVISDAMITGDADLRSLSSQKTVIAKGLGLWPEVIVDQHFLKRQRGNRLLSAVIDHPALVGVGIDEATAVIVRGAAFEVVGQSSVVVIDARRAAIEPAGAGGLVAARDLRVSVLHAGMSYSLR
ncbi:MAG TPA: cyanophycinase [Vicinamibacterales bacterium]